MKRVGMMAVIVMILAGLCRAGLQEFVDKVEAVNPVDRWMATGTIEFTIDHSENDGVADNIYRTQGILMYNEDHALLERYTTSGQPRIPPSDDPDPRERKVMADLIISLSPEGRISYVPSCKKGLIYGNTGVKVSNCSQISGGILDRTSLATMRKAGRLSPDGGLILQTHGDGSTAIRIDDLGRIVSMTVTRGKQSDQWQYADHVLVDGKWAPRKLLKHSVWPDGEKSLTMILNWIPGQPSDTQCSFILPQESKMIALAGAISPTRTRAATQEMSARSRASKPLACDPYDCWHCEEYGWPRCDSYQTECPCDPEITCAGQYSWFYIHHHHCINHCMPPASDCYWDPDPYWHYQVNCHCDLWGDPNPGCGWGITRALYDCFLTINTLCYYQCFIDWASEYDFWEGSICSYDYYYWECE